MKLGNSIRGRGGIQRRGTNSSGYNPNINVTGNDMPQDSNQPSKPFYRGSSMRGGRGGFHPNSRPSPMPVNPNHQQPGMMQPSMPVKRGPPMGPPGPKRGRYDQAPPQRMQKYPPTNMQGPPSHMAPNHHQAPQQQPQPNYNYQNTAQPMQSQNYYGSQGNGTGYDQNQSQGKIRIFFRK